MHANAYLMVNLRLRMFIFTRNEKAVTAILFNHGNITV